MVHYLTLFSVMFNASFSVDVIILHYSIVNCFAFSFPTQWTEQNIGF
jgi:hypothetical protein